MLAATQVDGELLALIEFIETGLLPPYLHRRLGQFPAGDLKMALRDLSGLAEPAGDHARMFGRAAGASASAGGADCGGAAGAVAVFVRTGRAGGVSGGSAGGIAGGDRGLCEGAYLASADDEQARGVARRVLRRGNWWRFGNPSQERGRKKFRF